MMTNDWPAPWKAVDDGHSAYIGRELGWELSNFPDHPLAKRSFRVVAMKDAYENTIIVLDDGTFAYVRLTWKMELPEFESIGGEAELVRFLKGTGDVD